MSIITFTSDCGNNDYVVAAIKGMLLQKIGTTQFIDFSLNIEKHNIMQAAYISSTAMVHYPPNSFHIILVDLFSNKNYNTILAYYNNQYIICPNNGVLAMIIKNNFADWIISLPEFQNFDNYTLQFGAQCTYAILNIIHNKPHQSFGTVIDKIEQKDIAAPFVGNNFIEAQILFIDNFENVVVNITKDQFETIIGQRKFTIVMRNITEITKINNHIGEVPYGEAVATFNMAGYLEIAVNQGNASGLFGLRSYNNKAQNKNYLSSKNSYQKVRIIFND
jgi:S-adenosyl-L-methionine hydrolase (adenosine-forming)